MSFVIGEQEARVPRKKSSERVAVLFPFPAMRARIADEERMIRDTPSTTKKLGEKRTITFAVLNVTCTANGSTHCSPEKRSRMSFRILPTRADETMFAASIIIEAAGS